MNKYRKLKNSSYQSSQLNFLTMTKIKKKEQRQNNNSSGERQKKKKNDVSNSCTEVFVLVRTLTHHLKCTSK